MTNQSGQLRDLHEAAHSITNDPAMNDMFSNYALVTEFTDVGVSTQTSDPRGPLDVPVVPEPASWALIILGAGLAGEARRRRGALARAPAAPA
ncbi:MAG: PEPxxWA-CTERM sorting domain-containing protein [Caulobacteraceae bacterium]